MDIAEFLKSRIPDDIDAASEVLIKAKLGKILQEAGVKDEKQSSRKLYELLEYKQRVYEQSGFHQYFVPGTEFGIENLPKHAAFFDATRLYSETLMLGGNRCGKTRAGATFVSILATGEYPEWWAGVRFNGPTHSWAAGKTGQSTRDTVQEAVLGPLGAWGTGALPARTIIKTSARAGTAGAVDTVYVRHVSGEVSTIGFKSYDQKPGSFFGTAKHSVWADEPCPALIYHEMLARTIQLKMDPVEGPKGGRLIHTITPKEGLTSLLADFLSDCDLLAGAKRLRGLDAIAALKDVESKDDYGYDRDE